MPACSGFSFVHASESVRVRLLMTEVGRAAPLLRRSVSIPRAAEHPLATAEPRRRAGTGHPQRHRTRSSRQHHAAAAVRNRPRQRARHLHRSLMTIQVSTPASCQGEGISRDFHGLQGSPMLVRVILVTDVTSPTPGSARALKVRIALDGVRRMTPDRETEERCARRGGLLRPDGGAGRCSV